MEQNTITVHFEKVHSIINLHRSKALKTVNDESLFICWNVGQYVSEKLKKSEWGTKVVTQLSEYLRTKEPGLKGYSRRNIYNMVQFYETYSSDQFFELINSLNLENEIVQTNSAQIYLPENEINKNVQTQTSYQKYGTLLAYCATMA